MYRLSLDDVLLFVVRHFCPSVPCCSKIVDQAVAVAGTYAPIFSSAAKVSGLVRYNYPCSRIDAAFDILD